MAKCMPTRLAMAVGGMFAAASMLYMPSASAISLLQAYQAALGSDATYLSAVQESVAGKEYRVIGRSNLLPQLSASYSASRIRADLTQPNFLGAVSTTHPVYISHSSVVQLRQPLLSVEAYARYKQGVAQTAYSDAQFDGRVQEMILRVSGAYIDALFAREQVQLSRAQRDTLLEQKQVNDHLFAKGEGTRTDMLETAARLDLAEAQLLEAIDNETAARVTLEALIGGEVTSLDGLRAPFRVAPLPEGGFEALKKEALRINPEIQAQSFAIESAKQEVNKARSGHMPRVDFVASYSKSNSDTINTYTQDSTSRSLGVQVNIPLYSGGLVNAQYRQAVAGVEKAKAELQVKIDKVTLDLRKSYAATVSSATKIPALEKAVESAQLLVMATEKSIKGGVRINLDLLNAKQQLFVSQRDLAQARYTYLVNWVRVKGSVGNLGASEVRELTTYFQ